MRDCCPRSPHLSCIEACRTRDSGGKGRVTGSRVLFPAHVGAGQESQRRKVGALQALRVTTVGSRPSGPRDLASLERSWRSLVLPVTSQPRQGGQALAAGTRLICSPRGALVTGMPVCGTYTEASLCSCQACVGSGLVEASPGASTRHRLPPLLRGPWAPVRTTAGSGPVPLWLLEREVPRDASPSLVPVSWVLGFGFLAIVLCSFIPACVRTLVHSCSLIHSLLRAARGRGGRPRAHRASLAPLLRAGHLVANRSSRRAWCSSGGCWEGGGFWRERVQRPVCVCRVCLSPACARRRAPSALLERVPPFPAYRWPTGASGHSWPRPPRAAVLTGVIRPSPTAIPAERVHLMHTCAP